MMFLAKDDPKRCAFDNPEQRVDSLMRAGFVRTHHNKEIERIIFEQKRDCIHSDCNKHQLFQFEDRDTVSISTCHRITMVQREWESRRTG